MGLYFCFVFNQKENQGPDQKVKTFFFEKIYTTGFFLLYVKKRIKIFYKKKKVKTFNFNALREREDAFFLRS